jgi:hypothetical protein
MGELQLCAAMMTAESHVSRVTYHHRQLSTKDQCRPSLNRLKKERLIQ